MKKTLALFMALAMIAAFFVGFAVNSSAAPAFVEETYTYADALEEHGKHGEDGDVEISEGGAYNYEEFLFCDGVWTYEYLDNDDGGVFKPMTAYFAEKQEGWVHGGWSNIYTANEDSAWTSGGNSYCSIMSAGKYLHPGNTGGCALTFIVPATGVISYDAAIYAYGTDSNTPEKQPETWGSCVWLYVNDTLVWPADEGASESNRMGGHNTSSSSPVNVSYPSFNANEGDRIRLVVTAYANHNGSKGTALASMPTVTYHSASVPIGNPKGSAPTGIAAECPKNTLNCNVEWTEAKNAAGYNLYLQKEGDEAPVKVNDAPVTGTSYTIEGLESSTLYQLTMTTVTKEGNESDPSEPIAFKSRKVDAPASTDTGDTTESNKTTDTPANTDTAAGKPAEKPTEKGGFPWWIIVVVAAVVVIAVVVVIIIVAGKKKKAAPAEAAPAEENKAE